MSVVISVENLGKQYGIGSYSNRSFREDFQRWWAGLRGLTNPNARIEEKTDSSHNGETIWALNSVSFDIKEGEAVGIIGRNGAGKSTLLKILSRITLPTEGKIKIKGRISSLLEVGTGFHPELTGRENIYLNGSILGMKRADISRKIDEIVDFSGVEKFIDTPVKRYSSGMYMRLAFSVAAHLDSSILILDEVLSVGDAAFQKKSLAKMTEFYREGHTVLFVSHSMSAVRHLCKRGIFLENGRVVSDDKIDIATKLYMESILPGVQSTSVEEQIAGLPPDPAFRFKRISLLQNGQPVKKYVGNGSPLEIIIEYDVLEPSYGLRVFFDICDVDGNLIFRCFHDDDADKIKTVQEGTYVSRTIIPENILLPIRYTLVVDAGIFNVRMCTPAGVRVSFDVQPTGRKNRAYTNDTPRGNLGLLLAWETRKLTG